MFSLEEIAREQADEGRRARKKRATRERLVARARRLMSKRGYEGTTMEAVAAAADVAVGGVYNYFDTKQALLLAVVGDACGDLVDAGEKIVVDPPSAPREAIVALLHAYLAALQPVERALLRQAFAVSFSEPPQASAELLQLDLVMVGQLRRLVERFQAARQITGNIEADAAALALYGVFTIAAMMWMSMPTMTETQCQEMVDAQLKIVFSGLLPREENS